MKKVEQIRHVGSILLELSHKAGSEAIKERAGGYLSGLLDVLSRLDSRASDALISPAGLGP